MKKMNHLDEKNPGSTDHLVGACQTLLRVLSRLGSYAFQGFPNFSNDVEFCSKRENSNSNSGLEDLGTTSKVLRFSCSIKNMKIEVSKCLLE